MEAIEFLRQQSIKAFIKQHAAEDIHQLILNPPTGWNRKETLLVADQILSRQKCKGKLNQWAANYDLILPPPISVEQASSDQTSNYKKSLINGDCFVDLTGGMGIDCLALHEQFQTAVYVEKQPFLCETFAHNIYTLHKQIRVVCSEAEHFLADLEPDQKTVFFLDPARRAQANSRVFKIEDCVPNLLDLLPKLQQKGCAVLVKLSPMLDISSLKASLASIREIHVVSLKNECKEVLVLLDFEDAPSKQIICQNLLTNDPVYHFTMTEERAHPLRTGPVNKYVYEPNTSILKAGAFKKIAEDFSLIKLGQHTHLYTSEDYVSNFPGKIFEVLPLVDNMIRKLLVERAYINVISRNYPLNTNQLKKKFKLRDGGNEYAIAYRDLANKPKIILAKRILGKIRSE